jgi:hypothetical protein
LIASLKEAKLNKQDAALLQRGYYEDLLDVNRFNNQLWDLYLQRPPSEIPFEKSKAIRETNNFLQYELVPRQKLLTLG